MAARKWFDRKMYPFMSLQVVIPIEALGALITLERTFIVRCLWGASIHLLHLRRMTAVEPGDHPRHAAGRHAHHRHLAIRAVYIGHYRTAHGRERVCGVWAYKMIRLL